MPRCHIYQNISMRKAKPLHLQHDHHHRLAHLKQSKKKKKIVNQKGAESSEKENDKRLNNLRTEKTEI